MYPILLHIGPLTLHTYGLFVAIGFLTGYYVGRKDFVRENFSGQLWENLVIWLMIGSLLGARVFYFGLVDWNDIVRDPLSFFRIWEGGLVFYGGFAGGFLALLVFTKVNKIPLISALDLLVKPLILGQALGRLGCFSAGCCYGKPTQSIFGVIFRNPDSLAPLFIPLHPTQIYESVGDAVIFILLIFIGRRNPRTGAMFASYLIGYGILRFIVEFFRNDDRGPFLDSLSPSQWGSILAIIIGISVWLFFKREKAK